MQKNVYYDIIKYITSPHRRSRLSNKDAKTAIRFRLRLQLYHIPTKM